MNVQSIALNHKLSIVLPNNQTECMASIDLVMSLQANLMTLGYMLSNDAMYQLAGLEKRSEVKAISSDIIDFATKSVGADVVYKPLFPEFPNKVMNLFGALSFMQAIIDYNEFGGQFPTLNVIMDHKFEEVKFKLIGVMTNHDIDELFISLVSSPNSLTPTGKDSVVWLLESYFVTPPVILSIPFKETMCLVAKHFMKINEPITEFVKTATDVLRIITALSDGDVSLVTNTHYISLPRSQRKQLISILENVIYDVDIKRHQSKWIKVFHMLHVGEYKWAKNINEIAKLIRHNGTITTYRSNFEMSMASGDYENALKAIAPYHGEFLRAFNQFLVPKIMNDNIFVYNLNVCFIDSLSKVSTKLVIELYGYFKMRKTDTDKRMVIPRGVDANANFITGLPSLGRHADLFLDLCIKEFYNRFETDDSGTVWIDERLKKCVVPHGLRSASIGSRTVARGTRLHIGDYNLLRMFIYWIGGDVDLSVSFYDDDMNDMEIISYINLSNGYCTHSGDIIDAPNGASEFVDIDINAAIHSNVSYAVVQLYCYDTIPFKELAESFMGWMERDDSSEFSQFLYDPKTVKSKIDINSDSTITYSVMFDLVSREMIFIDIGGASIDHQNFYTAESNTTTTSDILKTFVDYGDSKMDLYTLFTLHYPLNTMVDRKEDADMTFGLDDCDVNVYDSEMIQSIYMK